MAMSVNTDAATDKYAMKLFIVQYIDPNIQFLKKNKGIDANIYTQSNGLFFSHLRLLRYLYITCFS